ncbi:MAG TPA: hypothetical protein LFW21_00060 [Rickettsia endosymbiont of Pyrocoelia pectoralis]|nr:hypothetical protein [Rickettsia endosymbiont of Pyrocoelia pectoralis]
MADDQNNKDTKKDDAQVKNELNAIKAQVTATNNPAELVRLAGAAAGLASSTNNPEILEQIKNLQSAISKKEENAEQVVSYNIVAENLETQGQQQNPEAAHEQALYERHESLKASHSQFMKDADELIESKKKHNENLQSILDDLKAGREIDPEKIKSVIKTEEQIRKEREKEQALKDHQQQSTQHYEELQAKQATKAESSIY